MLEKLMNITRQLKLVTEAAGRVQKLWNTRSEGKVKILISTIFIFFNSHALSSEDFILEADNKVAGIEQHEFVNMWWQWAVSMSHTESPVRDNTGIKCAVNQVGPVWFLAGGYGSSKIKRTCPVPSNKHIFFPIINMLYYPPDTSKQLSCNTVKKGAALNNQYLTSFEVNLDKEQVLNPVHYRNSSKNCFDLIARKPNNGKQIEVYPAATDGYWIMLKPLPIGTHNLSFRAEYNRPGGAYGKMVQDIEYTLEVFQP